MNNCPVEEAAKKLHKLWSVEKHSCDCNGTEGCIMFRDGVVIRIPCDNKKEKRNG